MKNLKWLLAALVILSCSRGEKIRVSGIVENGKGGMIYLDEQKLSEIREIDSVRIRRNGSFDLSDRASVPKFYNLRLGDDRIIPLLLCPGDQVEVRTTDSVFSGSYSVEGSVESQHLLDLNRHMARTRKSLDSLSAVFNANLEGEEQLLDTIRKKYDDVYKAQRRHNIQFVLEHMTSMASIYAIYQKIDDDNYLLNSARDIQIIKITGDALDTIYPGSEYVESLKRDAAKLESNLMNRNLQNFLDAAPVSHPDIRLPDPYGDSISLSSLGGKVVLLSFWASWNDISVGLNQEFLRLYRKFHGRGLEIYQVSFDSELAPWMRAIQFDELPWINVSELSYPESSIAHLYNVTELPTYFLIDRMGAITGKNYDMASLDRKIAELVNQN